MKLMIASDIHGSAYYLEKLIDRFNAEAPDKLLLLGDILYHGPRNALPEGYAPSKVVSMLSDIKENILCVKGNCDADVDDMVLPFSVACENMLLYAEGREMLLTHGHKYSKDNPPLLNKGSILICGHTHIPAAEKCADFLYINPGSVSIPKESSPNSYIIFENNTFFWKKLSGEVYKEYLL